MERMIQLNLSSDSEKAAADNLPNPQNKELDSTVTGSKRLNKILRKAAHKASAQYGRNSSGVFSK